MKILLENEVFTPSSSKSNELPCRKVWDLVIYDSKNSMTKLEDLSEKGPFTAVAVAKDASEVRHEYVGCTVIISPIVEYSMEFPYGKEAIVWLRSNRAFYRVMSINPSYEPVWAPLKALLDISGHVINVMLKSTLEQLTMHMMKKVADLASKSLQETVSIISSGRAFIIEQIKNQHNPRLFKYQFFKDLSSAKNWLHFKHLIESEASSSSVTKRPPKPKPEESKSASKESLGKGKSGKASPPDPIPVKTTKSKSETTMRPKRLLEPQASEEDIFPSSTKARKNSGKSSSALRKTFDQKPLVASPPKIQTAKRTDASKSIFATNLIIVNLPSESDFDFQCPYCDLILQKSNRLTLLLPRVRIHLQLHSFNAGLDESFRGLSFSERFAKFTEKMSRIGEDGDDELDQSVLQWPKRESPVAKMDIDEPTLPIALVEVPVSLSQKTVPSKADKPFVVPVIPVQSPPQVTPVNKTKNPTVNPTTRTESSAVTHAPKRQGPTNTVAPPTANSDRPSAVPPAVATTAPTSKVETPAVTSIKVPRQPQSEPRTLIDVAPPRPTTKQRTSPVAEDIRAGPMKQPSVGSRASPLTRTLVGTDDRLSNAYARVTAPVPVQTVPKENEFVRPGPVAGLARPTAPPSQTPAPPPRVIKLPTPTPSDIRSTPFAATRIGGTQPRPMGTQHRPLPHMQPPPRVKSMDAPAIVAFKPSDFPINPPATVKSNMNFGAIDLTAEPRLLRSPVKVINLFDTEDPAGLQNQEVGSRLNRLPDVRVDKCWKCGFRVTSRICSQCESFQ